jgi:hypothetical protein
MKLRFSTSTIRKIAAFVFGASLVHAGTIVYSVNESDLGLSGGIGINEATYSVTIETNGTLGALDSGNIIGYSLLLNDGAGQTFTLDPGNSTVTLTGTATTATPGLLQFNYDSPDFGGLGYFEILDSTDGWGLFFATAAGGVPNGGIINPDGASTQGLIGFEPEPITLGTAQTPEPSSFGFMLPGLVALVWISRRSRISSTLFSRRPRRDLLR